MNPEKDIGVPLRECFTPPDDDDPPERGYQRSSREIGNWVHAGMGSVPSLWKPIATAVLVILVGLVIVDLSLLKLFWHLLAGWGLFLWQTVPRIRMDALSVVNGVLGLGVLVAVLHGLLAKVSGSPWRWRATLSMVAAVAVMFGICVATVGLVTSAGWASSQIVTENSQRRTPRMENARRARSLVEAARNEALLNEGTLPANLFGSLATQSITYSIPIIACLHEDSVQPSEYFVWLGNGLNSFETPGDVPVAMAPHSYADGKRLVAFLDERVEECTEEEWQAALSRWRHAVGDAKFKEERR